MLGLVGQGGITDDAKLPWAEDPHQDVPPQRSGTQEVCRNPYNQASFRWALLYCIS